MIKFELYKKGNRYWCGKVEYDHTTHKTKWTFYSSHVWPFYHGSYTQDGYDPFNAFQKFMDWVP